MARFESGLLALAQRRTHAHSRRGRAGFSLRQPMGVLTAVTALLALAFLGKATASAATALVSNEWVLTDKEYHDEHADHH
jgi:hypothetical protein